MESSMINYDNSQSCLFQTSNPIYDHNYDYKIYHQQFSQDSAYDSMQFSQQSMDSIQSMEANVLNDSMNCYQSMENYQDKYDYNQCIDSQQFNYVGQFSQDSTYGSQQYNSQKIDSINSFSPVVLYNPSQTLPNNFQENNDVQYLHSNQQPLNNVVNQYLDNVPIRYETNGYNKAPTNELYYVDYLMQFQPKLIENFQNYLKHSFPKESKLDIIEKLEALKMQFNQLDISDNDDSNDNEQEQNSDFFNMRGRRIQKSNQINKKSFPKCLRNIVRLTTDIKFSNETGITLNQTNKRYKSIRLNNPLRLEQYSWLIDRLIENCKTDQYNGPRDLYYQNIGLFPNVNIITTLLNDICCTVGVTRMNLNVTVSQKGFVFGDLTISYRNKMILYDSNTKSSMLIPDCIQDLKICHSNARFILVVEKYTTFAHLISNGIAERFPLIMITGSGYPDLKTRSFLQKLWFELKLPVFAFMDGDAYGIDIILSYKYGSILSAYQNHHLIVPSIQWLGITADDINDFQLKGIRYKRNELKKFDSLLKRKDVFDNNIWADEIRKMKQLGIKVEIQDLVDYSPRFLIDCYFPYKFSYGKWF